MSEQQLKLDNIKDSNAGRTLGIILEYAFYTKAAVERVKSESTAGALVVVFMLFVLNLIIAGGILNNSGRSYNSLLSSFTALSALFLCLWVGLSSICHFLSDLKGGFGRARDLFVMFGLSMAPFLLLTPLSMIIRFAGWKPNFLFGICVLTSALWSFILMLKSVKYNYSFTYRSAFSTLVIPFFAVAALPFAAAVVIALAIFFMFIG